MPTEAPRRGRLITLEGGEGAGKTTQRARLASSLRVSGLKVVETREPGGSPGAEAIRALLVSGGTDRWDAITEALLFAAARRDHLVRTVWPALEAGTWVVSDRFADSSMAYQGYGHDLPREILTTLYGIIAGAFRPDLTLILDLDPTVGLGRSGGASLGEDRFEQLTLSFHRSLRQGFLTIAASEPERCVVIDAARSADAVAADIKAAVRQRLGWEDGEDA